MSMMVAAPLRILRSQSLLKDAVERIGQGDSVGGDPDCGAREMK
jgi:hypothetical protein